MKMLEDFIAGTILVSFFGMIFGVAASLVLAIWLGSSPHAVFALQLAGTSAIVMIVSYIIYSLFWD